MARIRIGLIGAGSMGSLHARVIGESHRATLAWIADPRQNVGEEVAARFSTDWLPADTMRSPLPVALDLGGLYEQMLRQLMPTLARPGESMQALADRQRTIALKQRESVKLQASLDREKQFNRKVQLNAQLRTMQEELASLMQ